MICRNWGDDVSPSWPHDVKKCPFRNDSIAKRLCTYVCWPGGRELVDRGWEKEHHMGIVFLWEDVLFSTFTTEYCLKIVNNDSCNCSFCPADSISVFLGKWRLLVIWKIVGMSSHVLSVCNCLKSPLHSLVDTHFVWTVSRIIGTAGKNPLAVFVQTVVRSFFKNQNSKRVWSLQAW